jgi:hypothetical protein
VAFIVGGICYNLRLESKLTNEGGRMPSGERYPVALSDAEYRGVAQKPREYTNRDGQDRVAAERHLFEYEIDGERSSIEIPLQQLDEAADFDVGKLKTGDRLDIIGFCGEGSYGMYFRLSTLRRVGAAGAVRAA